MGSYYGDFVIPDMLAQPSDLAAWTGTTAPANATQLLRSATSLVLDATSTAYYEVDATTGLSTDTNVAKAMQDATCVQAAAWAALGIDPLTGGVAQAKVANSKGIGTAKIGYSDATAAATARAAAYTDLVPEALRKLEQANLLTPRVWTYG